LVWIHLYFLKSDRIIRIVGIFFAITNFRKKLMIRQSTFGGIRNSTVADIPLSAFLPEKGGHHIVTISYLAKGNWVYFVSSGNKE
jgi:hypothetical protein